MNDDDDDLEEAASDTAVSEDVGDDEDLPDDVGNGDISGPEEGPAAGLPVANTDDDGQFEGLSLTDADFEAMEVSEA